MPSDTCAAEEGVLKMTMIVPMAIPIIAKPSNRWRCSPRMLHARIALKISAVAPRQLSMA